MMEPPIDDTTREDWKEFVFKDLSTSDLIAELKKRRPCKRCRGQKDKYLCCNCIHDSSDNFKADKGGK